MRIQRQHGRWVWGIAAAGLVAAGLAAPPAFAADRGDAAGRPGDAAVRITPAFGAANVAPTQAVVFEHVQGVPPAQARGDHALELVVAVTNDQGTTLYAAPSAAVSVDRAARRVTWTPPAATVDGVTTSVLGRFTEDAVALVHGRLPGLTAAQRRALRQQGSVSLPGVSLAGVVLPAPGAGEDGRGRDAHPALVRGEVAGVQGDVLRLFDGPALALPAVRVQWPGHPKATLADLRPGLIVQVHEPPALRPAATDRREPRPSAPAAVVQVLPTPGVAMTVFTTGSAVGEPVVWRAQVATTQPSVLTGDLVTVAAQDSYGNPATTGSFTVRGQASPGLDASFSAPAGTIRRGQGQTTVTDHKAQAVSLTIQTQGPFSQDGQSIALGTVRFQPGPPADMTIQAASPLTAGGQEAVAGTVTDVYGNPVLLSALDFTTSAGSIASPVATQAGTGAYSAPFTAPDKLTGAPGAGETVTLAGRSEQGSAAAQTQVTVNPGPVAQLTLQAPATMLAGQTATITGTAQDVYGNAVLNGTAIDLAASAGSVPSSVSTQGGQFQAAFQAPSQPGPVTVTATANGVTQTATIQVTAPAPSGSIVRVTLAAGSNGTVTVSGTVTSPSGSPVAGTPVTLTVVGASPSTATVTTDSQGQFSTQVTPTTNQGAVTVTASTPTQGGGTASGQGWIDPLVYGNQPWTDTGLVVQAGQLVCVQATGGWVGQLYAAVNGSQGVPVQVGANGCFVSGMGGTLFLGTNGANQSGTVDANVAITAPNAVPTLDLTTSAATAAPGGQATISGQLMEGPYPVVGATISLSATAGSLGAGSATTDGHGQFQATWTAPQSGSATVTALYQPPSGPAIQQAVQETVPSSTGAIVVSSITSSTGTTMGPGTVITVLGQNLPQLTGASASAATGGALYANLQWSSADNPMAVATMWGFADSPSGAEEWGITVLQDTATEIQFQLDFMSGAAPFQAPAWYLFLAPAGETITGGSPPVGTLGGGAVTMPGSPMPAGTVAAGTAQYGSEAPGYAIDGNLATAWGAPSNSAALTLTFPAPTSVSSVGVAADAGPATTEQYTVQGLVGGQWATIGAASPYIDSTPTTATYFTIPVTPGNYSALRLVVNGEASWVTINEVTLNPPVISGTLTLTT